jgi:uncharacterized membrane protein
MNSKKEKIIILSLILILFIGTAYFYFVLPSRIATHWGISGKADEFSSKFYGLIITPIITLFLILLFFAIPSIDPLKENIKKFQKYYLWFIIVFTLFMMFIQTHIIIWNLGYEWSVNILFPVAIGILFIFISVLLKNSERNWFIGIRTPWTLSSDKVWKKTHERGSKLFFVDGVLSIIGSFFGIYSWLFIFVPIIISTVYLVIYSYVIYKKEN